MGQYQAVGNRARNGDGRAQPVMWLGKWLARNIDCDMDQERRQM